MSVRTLIARALGAPRRPLTLALSGVLAISGLGLPRLLGEPRLIAAFLLEAPLVFLGAWLALRCSFERLPATASRQPAVVVALGLLALLGLGQLAKKKQTYPFVAYTMYGNAHEEEATYYLYEATLRSGQRERFRPSAIFPALGAARILRGLARRMSAAGEPQQPEPSPLLSSTLRALMRLHNQNHPLDPVVRVSVYRVRLPPPFRAELAERAPVLSLSLDGT